MEIAKVVAQRGTCDRARVGAVLVKDKKIVSIGYNGSPSGQPHCDDVGHNMVEGHCVRTVHAEDNCLSYALKHAEKGEYTLYVTHLPCSFCLAKILQNMKKVRITRIVYWIEYSDTRLKDAINDQGGIKIERYQE